MELKKEVTLAVESEVRFVKERQFLSSHCGADWYQEIVQIVHWTLLLRNINFKPFSLKN